MVKYKNEKYDILLKWWCKINKWALVMQNTLSFVLSDGNALRDKSHVFSLH